jgi:hypothetical protein
MNQRIYHGSIEPAQIANALVAQFNRGNYKAQRIGKDNQVIVQIATVDRPSSGGQTALSVTIQNVEDGVSVKVGQQAWLGVAASLGTTALWAIRNPFSLLHRLDDLAQDIESFQLNEEVWNTIDSLAHSIGASTAISERLRRVTCEYCQTANPVGASNCIACGAPLGNIQPTTCPHCGYVVTKGESVCPNCGKPL